MQNPAVMPRFGFGEFVFDPSTGDLTQNGLRIRIDRQTAKLLQLFLLQAGNLITRDQIRETLWPENDFLNHDKVINNCVSRLRYIFGDDPRAPTFIERIPKLGYRLLIEVCTIHPSFSAETGPSLDFLPKVSVDDQSRSEELPAGATEDVHSLLVGSEIALPLDVSPSTSARTQWGLFAAIVILLTLGSGGLIWRSHKAAQPTVPDAKPISLGIAPFETNSPEAEKTASSFRLDLTDSLSQLPQIRMRAAHSMDNLKLDSADLPKRAAELGLDEILFGRFTLEKNSFHLQLEIVRGSDATHLATMQYWGSTDELVSLRDKIQQNIFFQLRLTATGTRPGGNTTDPKAYEAYLNGRYHFTQQTDAAMLLAVANFKTAIELDPKFAKAYAALGRNYVVMGIHHTIPRDESIAKATLALDEALRISPDLSDVHATRGLLLFYGNWDFPAAEREIRESIQMDPNQPSYHQALARVLTQTGRFDEALNQIELARDEDRGSIPVLSAESFIAGSAMRCDKMLAATAKLNILMQESPFALDIVANALWTCGHEEEAIKEWYRMAVKEKDPGRIDLETQGLKVFRMGGVKAYALLRLDAIRSGKGTLHPYDFEPAEWNANAGKDHEAIAILKRSFLEHDEHLLDIVMNPIYVRLAQYPEAQPMMWRIRNVD